MEMTLRWLKRSRDYFEAHKEEVVWFEGGPSGAKVPDLPEVVTARLKPCPFKWAARTLA